MSLIYKNNGISCSEEFQVSVDVTTRQNFQALTKHPLVFTYKVTIETKKRPTVQL